MNRLLKAQAQLANKPFGKKIFSYVVAKAAPFFLTIRPSIEELRPNYMRTSMKIRRKVHNHLKGVHATAICTLCEFAAGVCMEASVPKHRRWIPIGMNIAYIKLGRTDLVATCDLGEVNWDEVEKVDCPVVVKDMNDVTIVEATIEMKVSDKPNKN